LVDGVVPVAADFMTLYQLLGRPDQRARRRGGLGTANQLFWRQRDGTAAEFKT